MPVQVLTMPTEPNTSLRTPFSFGRGYRGVVGTCALALSAAVVLSCAAAGLPEPECDPADRGCVSSTDDGRGGHGGADAGGDPGVDDLGRPIGDARGGDPWGDGGGGAACDPRTCGELDAGGMVRPDTDGDGIADCVEGQSDPDADGLANCVDDDSDGDRILDAQEGDIDSDGDSIPDFLDLDSDNDNIEDQYELIGDPDEDGLPNYLDLDSDEDGWPDAAEYGRDPAEGGPPADRSGDGVPDFLDLDSDGDGLADSEELGCPTSTDRVLWDSDGDSYSDLVEVAFGSAPCDPASDISEIVDFYFELPYRDPPQTDVLEFSTDVRQGDIAFNMDTTGSMGQEIGQLQSTLSSNIIPALGDRLTSPAYAVSHFEDFPCSGYGSGGDLPFELLQRITQSRGDAQSAVDSLPLGSGADYFESGFESLYQIATGEGISGGCGAVPAFDAGAGFVEGVADGWIGGVGFREGALPIIVHITDAPSHANGEGGYGYGRTRDAAFAALEGIGARIVSVASGGDARTDGEELATRTGAVVPPCAWDEGRPGGCSPGQCCTQTDGGGRGTNGEGMCPLVFDISGNGSGLDASIVSGIDALLNFSRIDVSTRSRPDPDELASTGIDTTCFLAGIVPDAAIPRPGTCSTEPIPADFDGDGTLDGFENVTPGTQLFFQVIAENQCVPPLDEPQVFIAYIDVIGDGTTVLDTKLVTILVPPQIKF